MQKVQRHNAIPAPAEKSVRYPAWVDDLLFATALNLLKMSPTASLATTGQRLGRHGSNPLKASPSFPLELQKRSYPSFSLLEPNCNA